MKSHQTLDQTLKGTPPVSWGSEGLVVNPEKPLLTVLNYSGGAQSSMILESLLRGEMALPESFLVLSADPGMESSETYALNKTMRKRMDQAGIQHMVAEGSNLYQDLLVKTTDGSTRIENPPYWTKSATGGRGKLLQKCTIFYKIAPMDRAIRKVLLERFGINPKAKRGLGVGAVEKWIGFAADEYKRMSLPKQKYVHFRYPLIEAGFTREDIVNWYAFRGITKPPRSVCNACFANGVDYLKTMHSERPNDWQQAVRVDEAVRDMSALGVTDSVFVSKTLTPLTELAENGFSQNDSGETLPEKLSCDSGYCFT